VVETIEPLGTINERGVCEEERLELTVFQVWSMAHTVSIQLQAIGASPAVVNGSCDQRHTQFRTAQQQT